VGSYIVRRLLIAIPVFFGITILVFVFVALAPGDAAAAYAKPELAADPQALQAVRERFGLDQPIPIRYVRWLANALQGELGYRVTGGLPIGSEVMRALGASLLLTGTALVLGILFGIPLGILSAVRQYSKIDYLLTGITFLGISLPSFLLGLGLLYVVGLKLKLVPIAGMVTLGQPFDVLDLVRHLALPAIILGFGYSAIFMRYTRASMLEVINTDYITTARSKGLTGPVVIRRHAFRNALIPIIAIIALSIPEIVGAAVVTEQVFSWPGVGLLMIEGVKDRDYFLIMGVTIVLAVVVLIVNIVADVLYAVADPRIRYT
jgi:peptide/nickel transport system permease protein